MPITIKIIYNLDQDSERKILDNLTKQIEENTDTTINITIENKSSNKEDSILSQIFNEIIRYNLQVNILIIKNEIINEKLIIGIEKEIIKKMEMPHIISSRERHGKSQDLKKISFQVKELELIKCNISSIQFLESIQCKDLILDENTANEALYLSQEIKTLQLYNNNCNIYFQGLQCIESLKLYNDNTITSDECKNLSNLTQLSLLEENKITNKAFQHLTNLKELCLKNDKQITDEAFQHLTDLQKLHLEDNENITDEAFKYLIYLKKFHLEDNKNITDKAFKYLIYLKKLHLENNENITENIFQYLGQLEHLTLVSTVYDIKKILGQLPLLQHLTLDDQFDLNCCCTGKDKFSNLRTLTIYQAINNTEATKLIDLILPIFPNLITFNYHTHNPCTNMTYDVSEYRPSTTIEEEVIAEQPAKK